MSSSHRIAIVGAALLFAGSLAPAQARLLEPSSQGPLSNGVFSGLPIRASATARPDLREPVEVVGENCYIVRREGRTAAGRTVAYKVPVCE